MPGSPAELAHREGDSPEGKTASRTAFIPSVRQSALSWLLPRPPEAKVLHRPQLRVPIWKEHRECPGPLKIRMGDSFPGGEGRTVLHPPHHSPRGQGQAGGRTGQPGPCGGGGRGGDRSPHPASLAPWEAWSRSLLVSFVMAPWGCSETVGRRRTHGLPVGLRPLGPSTSFLLPADDPRPGWGCPVGT